VVCVVSRKNPLRAVEADEKPVIVRAKTVTEAAASGTTRELLVAMRDRIAVAVEDTNTAARDLAALTKRLTETVRDIEAIDAREYEEAGKGAEVTDSDFDAEAI
jgi:hypothetical protein